MHHLRALTLVGLAFLVAACGVKGDPVPPSGDENATSGISDARTGSVSNALGPSTGIETDYSISAGNISRNPSAARSSFFLDPLLN